MKFENFIETCFSTIYLTCIFLTCLINSIGFVLLHCWRSIPYINIYNTRASEATTYFHCFSFVVQCLLGINFFSTLFYDLQLLRSPNDVQKQSSIAVTHLCGKIKRKIIEGKTGQNQSDSTITLLTPTVHSSESVERARLAPL